MNNAIHTTQPAAHMKAFHAADPQAHLRLELSRSVDPYFNLNPENFLVGLGN